MSMFMPADIIKTNADIITTNSGGICGICQDEFKSGEEQLTHEGRAKHEGFHRQCLVDWALTLESQNQTPTCPYCRQPINRNSLITRTDLIMRRARSALANVAYAAGGAVVVAVGTVVALGAGAGAAATATAIGVGATGAGVAGAAAVGIAVGVEGAGVNWILNHREINPIDCEDIISGICMGESAMIGAIVLSDSSSLAVIAIGSLVAGVAAGVLSLMRRRDQATFFL